MKQERPLCDRSKASVTVHTDYDGRFRFVQCQRLEPNRDCTLSDTPCLFWIKSEVESELEHSRKLRERLEREHRVTIR